MTAGCLLGYVVLPCHIYEAANWYELPGYKTWTVGPNVFELLSFLGNKLPEILEVYQMLADQVKKKDDEEADPEEASTK